MKFILLCVFLLAVSVSATDNLRRTDESLIWEDHNDTMFSHLLGLIREYQSPVETAVQDPEFADLAPHWLRLATLIQGVMDRMANTPEKRKVIINKVLNYMRLGDFKWHMDTIDDDFDSKELLRRMATCGHENKYLTKFMSKAAYKDIYSTKNDIDEVVPFAVTYAAILDRVTAAARHDWHLLEKLHSHLGDMSKSVEWTKYANAFERAKKETIDHVVEQYLTMHKENHVPGNWGRRTLPLNIMEASLEDFRVGYEDNARSGMTLAFERPGEPHYDPITHAGPSSFSDDRNAILYKLPLPKEYADMYSTWNSAFVSHYGDAPFFWAKLFNPQVACYQEQPQEYLYNRVIALYLHIHFEVFARYDFQQPQLPFKWDSHQLTLNWARHNLQMTAEYEKAIENASGRSRSWEKEKITRVMEEFGKTSATDIDALLNFVASLSAGEIEDMGITTFFKMALSFNVVVFNLLKALIFA